MRHACKRSKKRTIELSRSIRLKHREAANREIAELKRASSDACAGNVRKTKAYTRKRISEIERQLKDAEARERMLFRKAKRKPKSAAAAQESYEEVARNLDAELMPVWRNKHTMRVPPGMSRTEAFLQWVHDNPDEVLEIQTDVAEKQAGKDIEEATAVDRRILSMLKRNKVTQADLDALKVDCDQVEALGLSCDDASDVEQAYTALHEEAVADDADPFAEEQPPEWRDATRISKPVPQLTTDGTTILKALREFGGMTEPELEAYTQLPEKRVYSATKALLDAGTLVRSPKSRELVLAPKQYTAQPPPPKKETYLQSRARLLGELQSLGWMVKPELKTPYAEGDGVRIYFKQQATYATRAGQPLSTARTLLFSSDKGRRGLNVVDLVDEAKDAVR